MNIRVSIIEDDSVLAENIGHVLEGTRGFERAGVHYRAENALRRLAAEKPAVVYLDLNLPKMQGVECIDEIRGLNQNVRILVVTVDDSPQMIFDALEAGASGYLVKPIDVLRLLNAIKEVHEGGGPLTPMVAGLVIERFHKLGAGKKAFKGLTKREKEVLGKLAEGYSNKELAAKWSLSVCTINNHVHNIYAKLHVNSRTAAVSKWLQR